MIGHSLRNYKYNKISSDLTLDFNNSDFNTCDNGCFVDLICVSANKLTIDLWASAGFHTKHNCRGWCWALASGRPFGWEWWLFRSESIFSRSESLFPPLRTQQRLGRQLWQKQPGDFRRYHLFSLKIQKSYCPSVPKLGTTDSVLVIGSLCWRDDLSTNWEHGILFKEKYSWKHHPRRACAESDGMLMGWVAEHCCSLSTFPCLSFPDEMFLLLRDEEKEKHWNSESWKLQVFSCQNSGERWKKMGTFLGQELKPCACHAGSEKYELLLFGWVTYVFFLGCSKRL